MRANPDIGFRRVLMAVLPPTLLNVANHAMKDGHVPSPPCQGIAVPRRLVQNMSARRLRLAAAACPIHIPGHPQPPHTTCAPNLISMRA